MHDDTLLFPIFDFHEPDSITAPILINSPHSGRFYSQTFQDSSCLDLQTLRSTEDAFLDDFAKIFYDAGFIFLNANYPRSYVDLNRAENELFTQDFIDLKQVNFDIHETPYARSGYGVIPLKVAHQQAIYNHKLDSKQILFRFENIYRPYHEKLSKTLYELEAKFGYALLVDLHSMPSTQQIDKHHKKRLPDIVIGNLKGKSCSDQLTTCFKTYFEKHGFSVHLNSPYAGGYNTKFYAKQKPSIQTIQIEINRDLYMDEEKIERTENINYMKRILKGLCKELNQFFKNYKRN